MEIIPRLVFRNLKISPKCGDHGCWCSTIFSKVEVLPPSQTLWESAKISSRLLTFSINNSIVFACNLENMHERVFLREDQNCTNPKDECNFKN